MNGILDRLCVRWGGLLLLLSFWLAPAVAETANVHLKDGTVMRGDVELTKDEVLIRNVAGVVRCPRARIARIEWLEPARTVQSEYLRRLYGLTADDVKGHFALAEWLVERKALELAHKQCETVLKLDPAHEQAQLLLEKIEKESARTADAEPLDGDRAPARAEEGGGPKPRRAYTAVEPPLPLSPRDILKLKLSEIELDGPAERLTVRFQKLRGEPDVEDLVREEMVNAFDYDPEWQRILERAQPYEKLPVVLKATGLKYANRIEVRGDPQRFSTYRRRVLPLLIRGCARSGCHGGQTAYVFRFPAGLQSSEGFVYTSFVMLDQMNTVVGPMLDRALPEESALLRYLLPAEEGQEVHPPVERGRVAPVLRGTQDPRYQTLIDWISSLRSPHPDYQLRYRFPGWFEPLRSRLPEPGKQPAEAEPQEGLAEAKPGEAKPAAEPDGDKAEERDRERADTP